MDAVVELLAGYRVALLVAVCLVRLAVLGLRPVASHEHPFYGGGVYVYVGPAELLEQVRTPGEPVASPADVEGRPQDEPFTYVVTLDGTLRIAPRRSEHVACAGGGSVLAAGEITFQGAMVTEVTNQSTGYCPGGECWPAVADALDRAGLQRPDGFTTVFVFRHCPECAELNVVKDEYYVCVFCDADLMRS